MRKNRIWKIVLWGVIGLVVLIFIYTQFLRPPEIFVTVQQEEVTKDTLYKEVFATGTINPIEMVDVGTQVSGEISDVLVDFNDPVKKGQVIARMDTRNLRNALKESRANFEKAKIVMDQAKRQLDRTKKLFEKGFASELELENAQNEYDNAESTFSISKLQVDRNSVNLDYAEIVSPIDGVVISRNIEVGQTVAATFSTPTLFSIANDLTEMKITASIDEADIGQVEVGQSVVFTVDAFPEDEFSGTVSQVQLMPTVVQNVVTYNVIVLFKNPDLKLMPGMTATLIVQTEEKPGAINVPNAALSFYPEEEDWENASSKGYEMDRLDEKSDESVWMLREKTFVEVPVTSYFTNGIRTAIKGDIHQGDSVITRLHVQVGAKQEGGLFNPPEEEEED